MLVHMMTALAAALLVATEAGMQPREAISIGGQRVPAGERLDVDLPVPAGASDPATCIPVTVFHGATDGPILALTAGVHGYEFPPILAAQALLDRIDPARLRGTVVLVRIANVAAFEQRVPYVNPFDRRNLNRVFPGRADGTQAERIAWALTTEVIRRCDAHVELHGGDGAEWLESFAGIYGGALAAGYETSRTIGLAFGLRNIIRYEMETQAQVDTGRSLNRQAVADGKPTVLIEVGENGRRDAAFVDAIVNGVENTLRVLGMTDGAATPPREDTRWFDGTASAVSDHTGIFTPVAAAGRFVRQSELLGTVRDYAGRVVQEITSPIDGYVMYGLAGPPVRTGESVATIARPAPGPL